MGGDERYVFEVFQKSGAGVSFVLAKDETAPSFMATYGWSVNFGLPEFIVCGHKTMLPEWRRIHNELIIATNAMPCIEDVQDWPIEFKGHPLISVKVDQSNVTDDWFRDALSYHRRAGMTEDLPAHQLFWADREGNLPWDEGKFSVTLRWLQPPLYEPGIMPGDARPRKDDLRHGADVLLLSNPRT